MLTPELLHGYQKRAVNHQCSMPHSMLWLDAGLGKTVTTLTTIAHLQRSGFLRGVLIVAPIRVIRMVWRQEARNWSQTNHLKFQMLTGTKEKRIHALMQPADVYLTNYEQLKWLSETLHQYFIKKGRPMPFNGVVWDEVSKMKNSTTDRVKAVRKILPHFDWTTGLTGTPASNGYKDLHGQFLVVDKGQRLGEYKTHFKTMFYRKNGPFEEVPQDGAEEVIKKLISDITLEMSAAEYLQLPSVTYNDIVVELPEAARAKYDRMEKEMFVRLDSGSELETFNQASLMNKLLQFSNGAVYPIAGMPLWEGVHDEKLDALDDLIDEANGQQIFLAYQFRSDAERIMKRFKALRPVNLTDCKSESALAEAMKRWSDGTCPLMIAHPASAGHGIDGLQKNGHIMVWFGLNWSLELYEQFNARINRQGQTKPVVCHRILTKDTLDMVQQDALSTKATTQSGLRAAVKNYRLQKGV